MIIINKIGFFIHQMNFGSKAAWKRMNEMLLRRRAAAAGALIAFCALAGCAVKRPDAPPASLVRDAAHEKPITIWFDATANWERLGTRPQVAALLDKCVDAGADIVVIDVKPISGMVLHASSLAPRFTKWKGAARPEGYDLLALACEEGHKRGLRVFASMNFFSEGHSGAPDGVEAHGSIYERPERRAWRSVDYVVPAGYDHPVLMSSDRYRRGASVFVSAACPEVVEYELAILKEILAYPIDGVCLDRVRFSGITADFSPWARRSFESFLGQTVLRWPEDIYEYKRKSGAAEKDSSLNQAPAKSGFVPDAGERTASGASPDFERIPGPLYKSWLAWRALTVRDIVLRAHALARAVNPSCVFADYTGAWYPDYYNEGVNWGSPDYNPAADYPDWAAERYREAGYAHLLDALYSGWYYTYVTESEAESAGVAQWGSMEGSAKLIRKVVRGACPVHASLYLFQYKDNPALFRRCMRRAYDLSDGLMLFDLVYLEQYNWWNDLKETFPEREKAAGK